MAHGRRPSICHIVPGLDLVPGSASTRQTLALARALAAHAEVTVAFRRVTGPVAHEPFDIVALEPNGHERLERPPGVAPRARAVHRGAMLGARHRARGHVADAGQADGVVRAARHPGRSDRRATVLRALARRRSTWAGRGSRSVPRDATCGGRRS